MIPGVEIAMGGATYIIPPLTLGQLRRLMPKVQQLKDDVGVGMSEAQIGIVVDLVSSALQRNYPDITSEAVEGLLDLGNAGEVMRAVLSGSGLQARQPGEAAAVSSGETSTVSSPQPADIDTATSTN